MLRDRLLFRVPEYSAYLENMFDSVARHECSIITARRTPEIVTGHVVLRNMRVLATILTTLSIVFEKRSLLFIGRIRTTTNRFSFVKLLSWIVAIRKPGSAGCLQLNPRRAVGSYSKNIRTRRDASVRDSRDE